MVSINPEANRLALEILRYVEGIDLLAIKRQYEEEFSLMRWEKQESIGIGSIPVLLPDVLSLAWMELLTDEERHAIAIHYKLQWNQVHDGIQIWVPTNWMFYPAKLRKEREW